MAKRVKKSVLDTAHRTDSCLDKFSCLPDVLVHHILSFLPIKQVVQTCVLSKKWKDLWCSVPCLDFNQNLFLDTDDFEYFVESMLLLHDLSDIEKLRVSWDCITDPVRVNAWIIFAIKHKIQVLDLELQEFQDFELTSRVFTCSSLKVLKLDLKRSDLNLPSFISLPRLKVFHLKSVTLPGDERLEALFSTCAVLETLVIKDFSVEDRVPLHIFARQLKHLTIGGSLFFDEITVSAPNLVSFKLDADEYALSTILFQGDLRFLIDVEFLSQGPMLPYYDSAVRYMRVIQYTESLTLSDFFLKIYAEWLKKQTGTFTCKHFPCGNLKWLKLQTSFSYFEILVIHNLLKHCPMVETLLIGACSGLYFQEPTTEVQKAVAEKLEFNYTLSRLKLVEIQGFRWLKKEVDFVKFLLKKAMILEKMIIVGSKYAKTSIPEKEVKRIGKELLSSPRASQNVGILLM